LRKRMLVATLEEPRRLGEVPSAVGFGSPEFYGTWPKRPAGYVFVKDGGCYAVYADEAL
jgi:hypothetical protein